MSWLDELKSPTFWATVGSAVALIAQSFTESGNPALAGAGAILLVVYNLTMKISQAIIAHAAISKAHTLPPSQVIAPSDVEIPS